MILLVPGPLQIGGIGLDVHTLLVAGVSVIIGVQVLTFWLCARLFASNIGLLPLPRALNQFVRDAPLGTGLIVGGLLFVIGLLPTLLSFQMWSAVQFGPLDYRLALRLLIPGLVALALGIHVFFASFIISLLNFTEDNWTTQRDQSPEN